MADVAGDCSWEIEIVEDKVLVAVFVDRLEHERHLGSYCVVVCLWLLDHLVSSGREWR